MSQVKLITLLTAGAILLTTPGAFAPAWGSETEDENVSRRLAFIEERLAGRDNHADYWHDGWLYAFTAITAGQVIALQLAPSREMQDDYRVGAITAGLGVVSQILTTNPAGNSHLLQPYPEASPTQREAKLAAAERLLAETARGERKAHAWWNNAGAFAVSTAAALVLGFHYNQPERAGLRWAGGLVVTQTRFWSQPTQATRAEKEYQQRFGLETANARPSTLRWNIVAGPRLTGISVAF